MNTKEITGELSRKTCLISSHVKRSPLQKNVKVKWFGDFIGVYMINSTLHGCLEIRNFSSHEKNISLRLVRGWFIR